MSAADKTLNLVEVDEKKVNVLDVSILNDSTKDVFLLKLPKELLKRKENLSNLALNQKSLKHGVQFEIDKNKYEAKLSESPDSQVFNCLFKDKNSYKVVNKFKKIIEVKRVLEVPKPQRPVELDREVYVPSSVVNYLENRKRRREDDEEASRSAKKSKSSRISDDATPRRSKRIKSEPV